MKIYFVCAALLLIFCTVLSPWVGIRVPRNGPCPGLVVSPRYNGPGISDGPLPLTPQERDAFAQTDKLERAAKDAKLKGNYALAGDYYHAETQVAHAHFAPWTWVDLGLMLDYQGKHKEAYAAYQKGLGPGNVRAGGGMVPEAEADARFGLVCEDRGLHVDACECYYAWWTKGVPEGMGFLDCIPDPGTTSAPQIRSLLLDALGVTLEGQRQQPDAETMAAFHEAARLAPDEARCWFLQAYGLRRAGRFPEAEAALGRASQLDKSGHLRTALEESLARAQRRDRRW